MILRGSLNLLVEKPKSQVRKQCQGEGSEQEDAR